MAHALDDAAKRWPEEPSRSRLLLRLVQAGHRVVAEEGQVEARGRQAAIRHTSGMLTGAYGQGYSQKLSKDWSE